MCIYIYMVISVHSWLRAGPPPAGGAHAARVACPRVYDIT